MANEIIYGGAVNWSSEVKFWLCPYFIFAGVAVYFWAYPNRPQNSFAIAWLIAFVVFALERIFWSADIKFWFGALLVFGIPAVYFYAPSTRLRIVFALLPLIVFGETILEYAYFVNKCEREAGVHIFPPVPAIDGFILAPDPESSLPRRSSCTSDCVHALTDGHFQFVEQKLFGDDEGWSEGRRAEALAKLGLPNGLVGWIFEKIPNNDLRCAYRGSTVDLSPDIFRREDFKLCVRRRGIFSFRSTTQVDTASETDTIFGSFYSRAVDLANQRTIGERSAFIFKGGLLLRPLLSLFDFEGVPTGYIRCDAYHQLPAVLEILGISAATPIEKQL